MQLKPDCLGASSEIIMSVKSLVACEHSISLREHPVTSLGRVKFCIKHWRVVPLEERSKFLFLSLLNSCLISSSTINTYSRDSRDSVKISKIITRTHSDHPSVVISFKFDFIILKNLFMYVSSLLTVNKLFMKIKNSLKVVDISNS